MTTLLYFTADWCSPCKRFFPIVQDEAAKRGLKLERLDVDVTPKWAELHDIRSLPTVVVVEDDDGIAVDRFGVLTPTALRDRLDRLG